MSKVMITLAEDVGQTTESHFAVKYKVDENDCLDFSCALKALGHDVFFVNWADLKGRQFTRMFHDNEGSFVRPLALEEMDLIFVYKMEGFYFDLPRFFAMVGTFEQSGALVVNDPRTIRHNIDKRYYWDLEAQGVRIIPVHSIDRRLAERLSEGETFVLKPRFGERGHGVVLARSAGDLETIAGAEHEYLAQEFMPAIRDGERSLVFLGLEYQHAVIKRPPPADPNEFRCNESLGGTVEVYEPTSAEKDYCESLLKASEALGYPVHFSRVDFVVDDNGPALIEAELLNPSIYANYSGKGRQFGEKLAIYFDNLIRQRRRSDVLPGAISERGLAGAASNR